MRRSGIVVILLLQRCRSANPDYPADETADVLLLIIGMAMVLITMNNMPTITIIR